MDKPITDFRRSLQLDKETDRLLRQLSNAFDGNLSMAARKAIRNEAERRGLTPAQDCGRQYAAQGR